MSSVPPRCKADRYLVSPPEVDILVRCDLRDGHDDPMAEIGGVRCIPSHSSTFEVDGATIEITWRDQ